jgi:hypothetical protein
VQQPAGQALHPGRQAAEHVLDSRVRNRISPIQTNSGSAVSVQLLALPQMVTAIASPAGRLLNSCMPIQATPDSVRPIQTPLPRMRNSATISSAVMRQVTHARVVVVRRARPSARVAGRHSSTSSSTKATARTTQPTAMASCGIHSGVASLPVEMSWNRCDCQPAGTL